MKIAIVGGSGFIGTRLVQRLIKDVSNEVVILDKPDFDMNELISVVNTSLDKSEKTLRVPYWFGLLAGYGFDLISKILQKEFPVSSIRVKKFCARTQFKSKSKYLGFKAPVSLKDALSKTVKHEFSDQ